MSKIYQNCSKFLTKCILIDFVNVNKLILKCLNAAIFKVILLNFTIFTTFDNITQEI